MAVCSVESCGGGVIARALCNKHYRRWLRYGSPLTIGSNRGLERKATRRAIVPCSIRDLEWSAGFIEGEGSFTKGNSGTEIVRVAQVDREPVAKLLSLFGGALKQYHRGKVNPQWIWSVCGARARGVALTLFPLLSLRRQGQIRRAIR